jgi:tripartite-type tricarboxylate transporter receptor subunit TctC
VPPGHNGLYTPKGVPREVKAALERACADALRHEAVLRAINNTGMTIKHLDGAQFHAQTAADYKFKGELIQRLGLKTE